MENQDQGKNLLEPSSRKSKLTLVVVIAASVLVISLIFVWAAQMYLFPNEFEAVALTVKEEKVLDAKIKRMEQISDANSSSDPGKNSMEPERYSEDPAMRTIGLSEKELNALLAKNTDLAGKAAIDLSDGMASAKLLIPLDEQLPVFGGKTLKIAAGIGFNYSDGKPVVMLKGVSLWGIPVPNAWLGNMKNVDLVKEFGGEPGFWKSFADGVDKIEIKEKSLLIRLKQ